MQPYKELNLEYVKNNDFQDVLDAIKYVFNQLCMKELSEKKASWLKLVVEQLHKGGGTLFKYIAKDEKAFLSVSFSSIAKGGLIEPNNILEEVGSFWKQAWVISKPNNPKDQGDQNSVLREEIDKLKVLCANTENNTDRSPKTICRCCVYL